jgi:hypothetical protein
MIGPWIFGAIIPAIILLMLAARLWLGPPPEVKAREDARVRYYNSQFTTGETP